MIAMNQVRYFFAHFRHTNECLLHPSFLFRLISAGGTRGDDKLLTAFPLIERLSADEGPLDVLLDVGVGHSTRKSPAPNPLVEGAESSSKNETEQVTIKSIHI